MVKFLVMLALAMTCYVGDSWAQHLFIAHSSSPPMTNGG